MDKVILPACYLPPVSYFMAMLKHGPTELFIEQCEHFPKQTYRNRTSIYGANGKLDLIIPIQHEKANHRKIKDIRINYDVNWQRLHWMSIQTAYRSSSYFEYYEDQFATFYNKSYEYLLDYNLKLTDLIISLLKIPVTYSLTESYQPNLPEELDFRTKIHPKKVPCYTSRNYYQVFADRHGYLPDLSIVDLLFNQGPQSTQFLSAP